MINKLGCRDYGTPIYFRKDICIELFCLSIIVEVTRNQLMKFFTLLSERAILRTLMDPTTQPKRASKPEKILFDNLSVIQALGIINKIGTVRESLVGSMLSYAGKLFAAKEGDFLLDHTYIFEYIRGWGRFII